MGFLQAQLLQCLQLRLERLDLLEDLNRILSGGAQLGLFERKVPTVLLSREDRSNPVDLRHWPSGKELLAGNGSEVHGSQAVGQLARLIKSHGCLGACRGFTWPLRRWVGLVLVPQLFCLGPLPFSFLVYQGSKSLLFFLGFFLLLALGRVLLILSRSSEHCLMCCPLLLQGRQLETLRLGLGGVLENFPDPLNQFLDHFCLLTGKSLRFCLSVLLNLKQRCLGKVGIAFQT